MQIRSARHLSAVGPGPRHPLADQRRRIPVTVIVLIGVLIRTGWGSEQVTAVLAVVLAIIVVTG